MSQMVLTLNMPKQNSWSLISYLRSDPLSIFPVPKNDEDRHQGVIFGTFLSYTLMSKPSQSPINFTFWIFLKFMFLFISTATSLIYATA